MTTLSGVEGEDPATGLPLPKADISPDDAFEWIAYMVRRARNMNTIVTIPIVLGPGLAETLLDLNEPAENDRNRRIRPVRVDHLSIEIKEGRWDCTGESIIVAKTGYMNNGQHRCEAVRRVGVAIETTICFGPTRESRLKSDLGDKRTSADHLTMLGEKYATLASVAARLMAQKEAGLTIGVSSGKMKGTEYSPSSGKYLSTNAGTKFYSGVRDEIQNAIAAITAARLNKTAKLLTPSVAIAVLVFLRRQNEDNAVVFMMRLLDGIGFEGSYDPIYLARKRLETAHKLTHHEKFELLFRAWNYWRRGSTVKKYSLTGELPELAK